MKKVLPFIFPAAALLVVLFLAYRWYGKQTVRPGQSAPFAEGVEIEDLSDTEHEQVMKGTEDYKSIDLIGSADSSSEGVVRYEIVDDKVRFSVNAALPMLENGSYQVWLKDVDLNTSPRKAFDLVYSKSGYNGSAAISADTLPFEVLVSRETQDDDILEDIVIRGILPKEE